MKAACKDSLDLLYANSSTTLFQSLDPFLQLSITVRCLHQGLLLCMALLTHNEFGVAQAKHIITVLHFVHSTEIVSHGGGAASTSER